MNAQSAELEDILAVAAQRGRDASLPYAGEVTPQEAHRLFAAHGAKIVDVRSRFEYDEIGRVPGTPLVSWKFWPSGEPNAHFLAELGELCAKDDIVLFLCRSGARSHFAAQVAAATGFTQAYNIAEGFEGDLDPRGQRGNIGGWRRAGLPWIQN